MGVFVGRHGFVSCEAARDLHELHDEQHAHPDELQVRPEGEHDGEGVAVERGAEFWAEDRAFDVCGGGVRDQV